MGFDNNAAVPKAASSLLVHLFVVLSLTGIGAFTAATSYRGSASASTHARKMVESRTFYGGSTKSAPYHGNSTGNWNDTSGTAALEATLTRGIVKEMPPRSAASLSTELIAETETDTYTEQLMTEIPLSADQPFGEAIGGQKGKPLKVLFLSADTGGGHRASAESLANQFQIHYPGSTYDLLDVWTADGTYPYKTLVKSYKHLSAHPRQWKFLYHISNSRPYELVMDFHSTLLCERRIRERIASYNPDVVVSVHPTMNYAPYVATKKISKALGKHIPFFTVVTDLGSGHCTWFQKHVEKMYIASDRIRKLAKRRGRTADEKIVMSGLPIRHDFALQAEKMGDRTSEAGKYYQMGIREELGIDAEKQMVLVMGGGEGVGSLSDIVDGLYVEFKKKGIDATICVVCGRNEKLRNDLATRDWDSVTVQGKSSKRTRRLSRILRRKNRRVEEQRSDDDSEVSHGNANVEVVGLGFVSNMAEYMVAADVLVSKAGPGTIAEAASVGLPVMLTSFLPGQEAGNVEVVLDGGFGDYNECSEGIAATVGHWLQDHKLLQTMSHSARNVGHPHAASDIVLDIGEITHMWMRMNGRQ